MNRVTLIGYLGSDAEIKDYNDGSYVRLNFATSEKILDEKVTNWHSVILFGKIIEWSMPLHKGQKLMIEGQIKYKEIEGKVLTSIIARSLHKMERNDNNDSR